MSRKAKKETKWNWDLLTEKIMSERKIVNLYSLFKDTPKKLKIVCDWDEVIQPLEPYATWLIRECGNRENFELIKDIWEWEAKLHKFGKFVPFWRDFWDRESKYIIEYSPYGSKMWSSNMEGLKRQIEIKNSPNFYQQAPFFNHCGGFVETWLGRVKWKINLFKCLW